MSNRVSTGDELTNKQAPVNQLSNMKRFDEESLTEPMDHTAFLSNEGRYTIFRFHNDRLKFIGPYSLVRYVQVKEWDAGYIVVMTKYAHSDKEIEEYIDLGPVLDNLYMDRECFLKPIRNVEVCYD